MSISTSWVNSEVEIIVKKSFISVWWIRVGTSPNIIKITYIFIWLFIFVILPVLFSFFSFILGRFRCSGQGQNVSYLLRIIKLKNILFQIKGFTNSKTLILSSSLSSTQPHRVVFSLLVLDEHENHLMILVFDCVSFRKTQMSDTFWLILLWNNQLKSSPELWNHHPLWLIKRFVKSLWHVHLQHSTEF